MSRCGEREGAYFKAPLPSVTDFNYSPALRRLGVTWKTTLDGWLSNPTAVAPGASMGIRVASAQERVDIIAYSRANPAR